MNIGFICKYPPTAGGESAKAYWLTRALAEQGNIVHVITNAHEVEHEFKERILLEDVDSFLRIPNLTIHATPPSSEIPAYIPHGNPFEAKLASIGLSVIQESGLDLIDSWYLLPNAVAAFMIKSVIAIPWAIRHAGSDLGRLLPHPLLKPLLTQVLLRADMIITHKVRNDLLTSYGIPENRIWFNDKVSVNTEVFSPEGPTAEDLPKDRPVILSIGKIGILKGSFDLLRSFVPFKNEAYLVFVTGGPDLNLLAKEIDKLGLAGCVKIIPPIPPWKVPSYLRGAKLVVHVERDFPIATHRPMLVREAIACGKCLLLSHEIFAKYSFLSEWKNVITVDPHRHEEFESRLRFVLDNESAVEGMACRAFETSCTVENFQEYLNATISLYEKLVR